ncbi:MAG: hypothetical protein ACTSR8_21265 [Promethearchaeota archaeon]
MSITEDDLKYDIRRYVFIIIIVTTILILLFVFFPLLFNPEPRPEPSERLGDYIFLSALFFDRFS